MKNISKLILVLFVFNICTSMYAQDKNEFEKTKITTTLNQWHLAAAEANFDSYFSLMTKDAIFIGTDASENWNLDAFKEFSRPYFNAGKAWNFQAIERNIYISGDIAWFDELLDTQMKICRGSGVLVKIEGEWKIKHYVLSIAIPNENVKEIAEIKSEYDENLIKNLKKTN